MNTNDDCDDGRQAESWCRHKAREERRRSILFGGKVQIAIDETDCEPGGVDALDHILTGGHDDCEAVFGPYSIDMTTGRTFIPDEDCDGPPPPEPASDVFYVVTEVTPYADPPRDPGRCPDCTTHAHCARFGVCWGG